MSGKGKEIKSDKFENTFYITDAEFAIVIARYLLKLIGLWPKIFIPSTVEKIISYFLVILSLFLIAFNGIPMALFIIIIVKEASVKLNLTGVLSFSVMAILKYTSLAIRQSKIAICITHIMTDWQRVDSTNSRKVMLTYAQYGRYGSIICAAFMYGGALFYAAIIPAVTPAPINENNETMRKLPYVGYYMLFDPQLSPAYEIVTIIDYFCAFFLFSITISTCSIAVIFVMHACGQLEILINWIKDFVNDDRTLLEFHEKFFQIIDQHSRTLRFINDTESILREICLVELVGCTLNICLIGYDILFEWSQSDAVTLIAYHILLMSFTFNIFLFCSIGEFLKNQCQKVGYTTYMMEWYKLPKNNVLGFSMLIATTQNPRTITAGKMFDLSISTFGSVIRTAIGYLNLLRALTT